MPHAAQYCRVRPARVCAFTVALFAHLLSNVSIDQLRPFIRLLAGGGERRLLFHDSEYTTRPSHTFYSGLCGFYTNSNGVALRNVCIYIVSEVNFDAYHCSLPLPPTPCSGRTRYAVYQYAADARIADIQC